MRIKNMVEELKKLTSRVQGVEGGKGIEGLNFEDLCIQPDVKLSEGYKPPKFEIFDGTGDPKVHTRTYCDKLMGVGNDERIQMKLFMRSLTGEALSWYISQNPKKWANWVSMASDFMEFRFNMENTSNVFYIQNLKKKPTETLCEYATRWRSEAAKVRPALDEKHMNKFFVRAQDPQYYERLIVIENHKFSNIIKLEERIEEGIKSGMVTNFIALLATKVLQSGGISKNKEVGAAMVAQSPKSPLIYQTLPPTYQASPLRYSQPATTYNTYNTQPAYYHSPPTLPNYHKPRPNFDRKPSRQYTAIAEPMDQLYERLKVVGYVIPIPAVAWRIHLNGSTRTKHSISFGMKGHTIDECQTLKYKIQSLIDNKVIHAKEAAPNVHKNPLPDYRGEGINVIETNEEWDLKGSIGLIKEGDDPKKPVVTINPIVVQV
ncbi:uncharacterized protein [Nicotiana sylvestris]|uniref:uncharacterized protein n=1 Tax=Nicotiana sylvestris TaxID=4096 RepID=UPI00388CCDE1